MNTLNVIQVIDFSMRFNREVLPQLIPPENSVDSFKDVVVA